MLPEHDDDDDDDEKYVVTERFPYYQTLSLYW